MSSYASHPTLPHFVLGRPRSAGGKGGHPLVAGRRLQTPTRAPSPKEPSGACGHQSVQAASTPYVDRNPWRPAWP